MYSQFLVVLCLVSLVVGKSFDLQILHFNDFHARFEPVNAEFSNKCVPGTEETCLGGISRLYSLSKGLKASSKNTLLLNAGDVYQGTLWYTLFKSKVTSEFMSQFPFDAFVVGNHDFDDGIKGLIPLLKKLKCPTVVANMDTKKEPSLKPYIKKSVVIKKGNQKIGIIGYDLQTFPEISRTGKLNFSDEATAVIAESKKLKSQGVNIIICLSHAGILKDIEVAEKADLVDVIVGGHSHTFMYTGTPPSYDKALYKYPHVVTQESGRKVLVVQAGAYSRYLGRLLVTFDSKGEVADFGGNPILLDYKVPTDLTMDNELEPYKEAVNRKGNEVKGFSNVELQTNRFCYTSECNMGNFFTDAMVYCYVNSEHDNGWTQAAIAVINAGGLRTSIDKGNVTYGDVLAVIPFGSTIDAVSLNGTTLYQLFEYTITSKNFLQWSGLEVTMDPSEPEGNRVKELKVLCTDCEVPVLEPVEEAKYYRVLVPTFLYKGGDGYTMFAEGQNHTIGMLDSDCFFSYLKRSSPVTTGIEGRIHLLNEIKEPREHLTIFN